MHHKVFKYKEIHIFDTRLFMILEKSYFHLTVLLIKFSVFYSALKSFRVMLISVCLNSQKN